MIGARPRTSFERFQAARLDGSLIPDREAGLFNGSGFQDSTSLSSRATQMRRGSTFDAVPCESENENRRVFRIGCFLCSRSSLWKTGEVARDNSYQRTAGRMMMADMKIDYGPIGVVRSPFKEPKGTPIQPSRAKGAEGTVEVFDEFVEGLSDLDAVSYTHLTLPTTCRVCRSRWSPYH